jgi:hypothetical protein
MRPEEAWILSQSSISKIGTNTGIKNNLTATKAPTIVDDISKGYTVGSTWIYAGTTYQCTDATSSNAKWVSSTDIFYFDTWSALVAAISVVGTTYVNKYANVANANNAPSGGTTYTAPNTLTDYIVDGGSATYKINAQGTNYSVTCQARTINNPIVTSIMLVAGAKPTAKGYYIFTVAPTGGLPVGIGLNDIAYFDGSVWSLYQSYARANTVLVANDATGLTQVTWRKFNSTWMSTAEEYIPDGKEYQTGKLYNGKPVYRKCANGTMTGTQTVNTNAGFSVPMTGKVIYIAGVCTRTDNAIITITGNGEAQILVQSNGTVVTWTNSTLYLSRPFTAWVEYTKS